MFAEQENSKRTLAAKQMDVAQKERDSQRDYDAKLRQIETTAALDLTKHRESLQSAHQLEDRKAQNTVGLEKFKVDQSLDLESRKVKAQNQPVLEIADQVKEMASALNAAMQAMQNALQTVLTAKRQIRRGKGGRAEGVDIVGGDGQLLASQTVTRGADGRVTGAE